MKNEEFILARIVLSNNKKVSIATWKEKDNIQDG